MTRAAFNRVLWSLGLVALTLGTAIYFLCRPDPPLLIGLWLGHGGAGYCGSAGALGSLPSALHALGFTSLLAACWNGTRLALAISGLFWFAGNALWEWSCAVDFPWPQIRMRVVEWLFMQPGLVHACTADPMDVFAAAAGAAVPLFLRFALCSTSHAHLARGHQRS